MYNIKKIIFFLIIFFFIPVYSFSKVNKMVIADSVFNYICQLGIKHPEIVIKQTILETGWYSDSYLMSRNNLFAFRTKKYLKFKNWKASVEYYKKWQDKHYLNSDENYYRFLIRIKYATNKYPVYLKKIKYVNSCK